MEKKIDVEKLMDLILKEADEKALNASYNGSMGDYGASVMREQVRFYRLGQKKSNS